MARRIGVCPKTLFRWADQGLISRHKISARTVLFDSKQVLEFVAAARVGGAEKSRSGGGAE